jgi:hypothetical protein
MPSLVFDFRDINRRTKGDPMGEFIQPIHVVQVYLPEDCQSGACGCDNAESCKFKRCDNCDSILNANGKAHDFGRWINPTHQCPDCGGDAAP